MKTAIQQSLQDVLSNSQNVLILTHDRPTADSLGSALSLYLALVDMGKKVTIACPEAVIVELSNFIGANKVVTEIGKKNFVISLDYVDGSIEKVSYNIEGNKFNLVIEPRNGFDMLSEDQVHFTKSGIAADVIFTIDTPQLNNLKKLYSEQEELFSSKPVVNIDSHQQNAQYGTINIVHPHASSTAEIVFDVLQTLEARLTQDIATNLLNSLYSQTSNFTSQNTTAHAFEVAAELTRVGGVRFKRSIPVISEEIPEEEYIESLTQEDQSNNHSNTAETPATPPDWLKPKIFKSSSHG